MYLDTLVVLWCLLSTSTHVVVLGCGYFKKSDLDSENEYKINENTTKNRDCIMLQQNQIHDLLDH